MPILWLVMGSTYRFPLFLACDVQFLLAKRDRIHLVIELSLHTPCHGSILLSIAFSVSVVKFLCSFRISLFRILSHQLPAFCASPFLLFHFPSRFIANENNCSLGCQEHGEAYVGEKVWTNNCSCPQNFHDCGRALSVTVLMNPARVPVVEKFGDGPCKD